MNHGRSARDLLAAVPDVPRWIETRAMLLTGEYDLLSYGSDPRDFIVRARSTPLVVISGEPNLNPLEDVSRQPEIGVVLCEPESADRAARFLPGWNRVDAVIHRLAESRVPVEPAPGGVEVGILPANETRTPADRLSHLPGRLRQELLDAVATGHVVAAFVDHRPVAFCYPAWETEALWDASVDTLPGYRRRGLAAACASFAIDHMRRHGKEPVWGALADNEASLALAAKLGFEPEDRMAVLRPGTRSIPNLT